MRKYMLKKTKKTTQHKYKHQITPSNKQKTEILNMAPVYQGGCQPSSLHKPVPYQNLELHSFMSKTALWQDHHTIATKDEIVWIFHVIYSCLLGLK